MWKSIARVAVHRNGIQSYAVSFKAFVLMRQLMANRDLGIHLNISRLPIFGFGTLTHEDREIRRRVFWSAYTWDKVSLGKTHPNVIDNQSCTRPLPYIQCIPERLAGTNRYVGVCRMTNDKWTTPRMMTIGIHTYGTHPMPVYWQCIPHTRH